MALLPCRTSGNLDNTVFTSSSLQIRFSENKFSRLKIIILGFLFTSRTVRFHYFLSLLSGLLSTTGNEEVYTEIYEKSLDLTCDCNVYPACYLAYL